MSAPSAHAGDLRRLLLVVTEAMPPRRDVNAVISLCHDIATALLRKKISRASLEGRFHYGEYRDLAYDCLGELCRQGGDGSLIRFRGYFAGVRLEEVDDAELLIHLRRLVASGVNQAIFRIYGEADPQLAKILRNIKLALQAGNTLVTLEKFGEWYLAPAVAERNEHLPLPDPGTIQSGLSARALSAENIPQVLSALSIYLAEQTAHARLVLLLDAARIIRSLYSQTHVPVDHEEMEDPFLVPDIQGVITRACSGVKAEYEPYYVGEKGVPEQLYGDYIAVVAESLQSKILGQDGALDTLFERLRGFRPDLTREQYYRDHRSVLEYLLKLSTERVARELKARP